MSLRDFTVEEWEAMSDSMRAIAAVSGGMRIRELERQVNEGREILDSTRDHADIQRRRIEIAGQVLHESCMKDVLEKVAAVLWPAPAVSGIDLPTEHVGIVKQSVDVIGVINLFARADAIFRALESGSENYEGVTLGAWVEDHIKTWRGAVASWRDEHI